MDNCVPEPDKQTHPNVPIAEHFDLSLHLGVSLPVADSSNVRRNRFHSCRMDRPTLCIRSKSKSLLLLRSVHQLDSHQFVGVRRSVLNEATSG